MDENHDQTGQEAASPAPVQYQVQNLQAVEHQFKSGANWFFWIAALSIINSVIALSDSKMAFIIGLGITQIIDALARAISENMGNIARILGLFLNMAVAGVLVFFGILCRKKLTWAFITGMVLYGIDGLLFVLARDLLSIAFHVFALFCIFKGLKACTILNEAERQQAERQQAAVQEVAGRF